MSNLMKASNQWASRPDDERFWTVEEMLAACEASKDASYEAGVNAKDVSAVSVDNALALVGPKGVNAYLTHYSFGQIASLVKAPAAYLQRLPASMAASLLNHGMEEREFQGRRLVVLGQSNGSRQVRAVTSERYCRIWDADIARSLLSMRDAGWHTAPARPATGGPRTRIATEADLSASTQGSALSIKVGDTIAPAGLYASDHDMFAFMIRDDRPIVVDGGAPLYRGFFVSNSEVGDKRFEITTFLYNSVCGNHIVWGAKDVKRVSIVHSGNVNAQRARVALQRQARQFGDASDMHDRSRILNAMNRVVAPNRYEAVEKLYEKRISTRQQAEDAVYAAEAHPEDHNANPRSAWAIAQGYTRIAQKTTHMDERAEVEKSATKVLSRAF